MLGCIAKESEFNERVVLDFHTAQTCVGIKYCAESMNRKALRLFYRV